MPLDDIRPSRLPRPAPVADPPDDAELDEQLLAELRQQIKDIDEGREVGMPWEEAMKEMFKPFTPEELAEIEAHRSRRASG